MTIGQKQKIKGLILWKNDYKEDSLVISVFTKDGIQDFIVRAAKRISSKLRPFIQEMTYVELVTTANMTLNTLTEGYVVENYTTIKEDTVKTLSGLAIIEYIKYFYESLSNKTDTYEFILKSFNLLKKTNFPKALLLTFETKFLYGIGIGPHFDTCVKCDNQMPLFLDVSEGGLVCQKCRSINSYSQSISKLFSLMYHIKMDNINDEFLQLIEQYYTELHRIVKEYYYTYFDFINKNHEFLNVFLKDN